MPGGRPLVRGWSGPSSGGSRNALSSIITDLHTQTLKFFLKMHIWIEKKHMQHVTTSKIILLFFTNPLKKGEQESMNNNLLNLKSLPVMAEKFYMWLEVNNYSSNTVRDRRIRLKYFLDWCKAQGIETPAEVTREVIEAFQRHIYYFKKVDGEVLAPRTQLNTLSVLRTFFKWMARYNHILYNPTADIQMPKVDKHLNYPVLSVRQIEHLLRQPDIETPLGLRDRAILETFYFYRD